MQATPSNCYTNKLAAYLDRRFRHQLGLKGPLSGSFGRFELLAGKVFGRQSLFQSLLQLHNLPLIDFYRPACHQGYTSYTEFPS